MPKYIKLFENFTNGRIDQLQAKIAELDSLKDFAVISDEQYKDELTAINKKIYSYYKELIHNVSNDLTMYSNEWFAELGKYPNTLWLFTIKSQPEYANLLSAGLYPVSSPDQLATGVFAFANTPNYNPSLDYSIVLSSRLRWIITVPRPLNGESVLKKFSSQTETTEFFKLGMKWIIDNIDLTADDFPLTRTSKQTNDQNPEIETDKQ